MCIVEIKEHGFWTYYGDFAFNSAELRSALDNLSAMGIEYRIL